MAPKTGTSESGVLNPTHGLIAITVLIAIIALVFGTAYISDKNSSMTLDNLDVKGTLNGLRRKVYIANVDIANGNYGNGASLGQALTGFRTGHSIILARIEIITPTNVDIGSCTLAIGNETDTQSKGIVTSGMSSPDVNATDTATDSGFQPIVSVSGGNAFSDTNNSVCLSNTVAVNGITAGSYRLTIEVVAMPSSPPLP